MNEKIGTRFIDTVHIDIDSVIDGVRIIESERRSGQISIMVLAADLKEAIHRLNDYISDPASFQDGSGSGRW